MNSLFVCVVILSQKCRKSEGHSYLREGRLALAEEDLRSPSDENNIAEGEIRNKRTAISLLQARKYIHMIFCFIY